MATQVDVSENRIAREQQIAATTSATAALLLQFPTDSNDIPGLMRELIISASSADITFNFGNSAVSASTTVDGTTKALPDGNFTVLSGSIFTIRVNPRDQNYVSVKTASGSGTATIRHVSPLI